MRCEMLLHQLTLCEVLLHVSCDQTRGQCMAIVISSSTLNMLDSGKLAYKINTVWMQMS